MILNRDKSKVWLSHHVFHLVNPCALTIETNEIKSWFTVENRVFKSQLFCGLPVYDLSYSKPRFNSDSEVVTVACVVGMSLALRLMSLGLYIKVGSGIWIHADG